MDKVRVTLLASFIILAIFFIAYLGIPYVSQNSKQPTLLTVAGEGKAKAKPELAQITVSYVATASSAAEALKSEKTKRDSIISLLASYGVTSFDIQIPYPRVVPATTASGTIYQAVNALDVKFKRLTALDEAVSKLYDLGNLTVSNIVLTTSNPRNLEDEAIRQAYQDAASRASKMAESAGKTLGKLVSMSGQQTQAVGTTTRSAATKTDETTPPEQIEIVRTVSLVYELK